MSKTTKTIMNRQWQIIDFLTTTNNYVSAEEIRQHLENKGAVAELRTIQRDLNDLKDVIPLECRTDDKPYGWRWARIEGGKKHELSLVQALGLRLVETQLQGHLPDGMMQELQPLFKKARFILSNDYTISELQDELFKSLSTNLPVPKDSYHPRGIHPKSRHDFSPKLDTKPIFSSFLEKVHARQERKAQIKLMIELKHELDKLELKSLAKAIGG